MAALGQPDSVRLQRIGLAYFSEGGLYPGFTFNYEKRELANRSFQLLLAAKAGAYFHFRNHTGVFVMVQYDNAFVFTKIFFLNIFWV